MIPRYGVALSALRWRMMAHRLFRKTATERSGGSATDLAGDWPEDRPNTRSFEHKDVFGLKNDELGWLRQHKPKAAGWTRRICQPNQNSENGRPRPRNRPGPRRIPTRRGACRVSRIIRRASPTPKNGSAITRLRRECRLSPGPVHKTALDQ